MTGPLRGPGAPGPASLVLALLAVVLVPSPHLRAQVEARPQLRGAVLRGGEPVEGRTVTLHRVSADTAGELDRRPTDAEGRFTFPLPSVPDPGGRGDVYFASVRHQGILYFGPAVTRSVQLDSLYRIQVHDTATATSGGVTFPVEVRNLFLERAEEGWRVVDLLQIRNEGDRTLVAPDDGFVWSYPMPGKASDFEVGESDLAPDAVTFTDEGMRISSPVPPGERTYLVRYRLPDLDFSLPMPGRTGRFEMLVQEPAPSLDAPGLSQVETVELEPGRSYRRFAGSEIENRVLRITPTEESRPLPVRWIAVVLALVLTGAGIVALRSRRPEPAPEEAVSGDSGTREALLLRIAELDDRFEARDAPSDEQRARYRRDRARLLRRLREVD